MHDASDKAPSSDDFAGWYDDESMRDGVLIFNPHFPDDFLRFGT